MIENACINCQYKYLDAPCRDCMSHDSLIAEVERLKQEIERLKYDNDVKAKKNFRLEEINEAVLQENKQQSKDSNSKLQNERLKEALRAFVELAETEDIDAHAIEDATRRLVTKYSKLLK